MKNQNKKAICILGGMGPEVSGYLYKLLIDLSIKHFGARNNNDFPEIILYSVPVPDFISDDKSRNKALEMLRQRVRMINRANACCLSIACNTAHILLEKLKKESKTPFVSMIDETAKQVYQSGNKKVGIMGTPSTIKYNLYQTALGKSGISTITPSGEQMQTLEKIIRNVIKGQLLASGSKLLKRIADDLASKGAQGIVLGCTELPLVFPKSYSLPVYNSVAILAMALLQKYYKQNTMRQR